MSSENSNLNEFDNRSPEQAEQQEIQVGDLNQNQNEESSQNIQEANENINEEQEIENSTSDEDNEHYDDANDLDIYFVNVNDSEDEDDLFDTDVDDEEEELEDEADSREEETVDDYENLQKPDQITYNTELPASHNYLGSNFQDIQGNKDHMMHESHDEITIPLLSLPGNSYYEHESDNYVQLIPGQVMPVYFYSPIQTRVIRKRVADKNPTIGFVLSSKALRISAAGQQQQQQTHSSNEEEEQDTQNSTANEDSESLKLGILAEIISASYQNNENEIIDFSTLVENAGGIIVKIKGRERFKILNIHKDITGCFIGRVKILPEYVLEQNPLLYTTRSTRNITHFYESYLHHNIEGYLPKKINYCSQSKADILNTQLAHPAWSYRKYDCKYMIYLIRKELLEAFQQEIPFDDLNTYTFSSNSTPSTSENTDNNNINNTSNNAIVFCSWLMTNFPFDNKMRLECLKMNCINVRLIYMYSLIKGFTNINCRLCGVQFCSKFDVFSISKHVFMGAYLNPGGVVHETLTVYKLKNFSIISGRPSTQHSWFPGII